MSFKQYFATVIVTFLLCTIAAQNCLALSVQNIRFGVQPEKTRLVFDLDQKTEFKVFVLPSPYRLVIDMPHFEWQVPDVTPPKNSNIAAVRHGNISPGASRIVLDLQQPVAVRSAFLLPADGSHANRLVVDFNTISETDFWSSERNKQFGTLNINATVVPPATTQAATKFTKPPTKPQQNTNSKPTEKTYKPLIVIDPGHGGVDPGAIGANKAYEKHVVLKIAKELRDELKKSGQYRVVLTREKDVFIKLRNRVKFARDRNADLFVSIHADSIEKKNVSGTSFYTLSENASDAQTAKLADRENRADLIAGLDLSTEDDEVASILVDLTMRDTTNQAKFLANKLVNTFKSNRVKTLDTAHRHAGFAVLKAPDIPSVLVETGFMSNPREARLLQTAKHRKKIVKALKSGIDKYFEQVRKNQRL